MGGTGGAYNPAGAHLMVCISMDRINDRVIVVPITSRHEYSDTSCCLYEGEHNFIRHDSVASYEFCQVLSISSVEEGLVDGTLKSRAPMSDDMLKRLQVGLVTSDEVTPNIFDLANGDMLTTFLKGKGLL